MLQARRLLQDSNFKASHQPGTGNFANVVSSTVRERLRPWGMASKDRSPLFSPGSGIHSLHRKTLSDVSSSLIASTTLVNTNSICYICLASVLPSLGSCGAGAVSSAEMNG
jgi:hypothetical protein